MERGLEHLPSFNDILSSFILAFTPLPTLIKFQSRSSLLIVTILLMMRNLSWSCYHCLICSQSKIHLPQMTLGNEYYKSFDE